MAVLGRTCLDPTLPWEVQRRRLSAMSSLAGPIGLPVANEIVAGVPVERLCPAPAEPSQHDGIPAATVVHFHGGGYCVGSPRQARPFAAAVVRRTGLPVVLPRYRLAPEHPHPAGLADAVAVVQAVGEHGPVVVSGDSAGAGLALAAVRRLARQGGVRPLGIVLLSPWLDVVPDVAGCAPAARRDADADLQRRDVVLSATWLASCARAYVGAGDPASEEVSPLHGDLRGLPPVVVLAAGDDLLRPDAEALAVRARAAGVPVSFTVAPGLWHDYALQAGTLAAADAAVDRVAATITAWLQRLPGGSAEQDQSP